MLEKLLIPLFRKYLDDYFELSSDSNLNLSLTGGKVHLKDVKVKPALLKLIGLENVDLDVGYCKEMKVEIPWLRIRSQSIRVSFSDVFILVKPRRSSEWNDKHEKKKRNEKKKKILKKFPRTRRRKKTKDQTGEKNEENKKEVETQSKKEKRSEENSNNRSKSTSLLDELKESVAHNVNVSITNIHMRYEDIDRMYIFGAMLENFEMFRSTEDFKPQLKNIKSASPYFYNCGSLQGLSAYICHHKTFKNLVFITTLSSSDEKIKNMSSIIKKKDQSMTQTKVLELIGGSGQVRRKRLSEQRTEKYENEPNWNINVILQDLHLRVSQLQKESVMDCMDYMTRFRMFEKYRKFRPIWNMYNNSSDRNDHQSIHQSSTVLTHPKKWWRYLLLSSTQEIRSTHYTFKSITRRKRVRKRYIQLYKKSRNLKWNKKSISSVTRNTSQQEKSGKQEEEEKEKDQNKNKMKKRRSKNYSWRNEFKKMEEELRVSDIYFLREFACAEIQQERIIHQKNLQQKGWLEGLFGRSTKQISLTETQKQKIHQYVRSSVILNERKNGNHLISRPETNTKIKKRKRKTKKNEKEKKYNSLRWTSSLKTSEIQLIDDETVSPILRFVISDLHVFYDEKGDKFYYKAKLGHISTPITKISESSLSPVFLNIRKNVNVENVQKDLPLVMFKGVYYENNENKVYHPYDSDVDISIAKNSKLEVVFDFGMFERLKRLFLAQESQYYHFIENPHPRNPNHYKRKRRQAFIRKEAVSNRSFKASFDINMPKIIIPITTTLDHHHLIKEQEEECEGEQSENDEEKMKSSSDAIILDLGIWKGEIDGPFKHIKEDKTIEYYFEKQKIEMEGLNLLISNNYLSPQQTLDHQNEEEEEESLYFLDLPDELYEEEIEGEDIIDPQHQDKTSRKVKHNNNDEYIIPYLSININSERSLTSRGVKNVPFHLIKNGNIFDFDLDLSESKMKPLLIVLKKLMQNSESIKRVKSQNEFLQKMNLHECESSSSFILFEEEVRRRHHIFIFSVLHILFQKINFRYDFTTKGTQSNDFCNFCVERLVLGCDATNQNSEISFSSEKESKESKEEEKFSTKGSVIFFMNDQNISEPKKKEAMSYEYVFGEYLTNLISKDPEKCMKMVKMMISIMQQIDDVFGDPKDQVIRRKKKKEKIMMDGRWDLMIPIFFRNWIWRGLDQYFCSRNTYGEDEEIGDGDGNKNKARQFWLENKKR